MGVNCKAIKDVKCSEFHFFFLLFYWEKLFSFLSSELHSTDDDAPSDCPESQGTANLAAEFQAISH